MSEQGKITVKLAHQPDDEVWLATSRDLPGLFVEGDTPDELMDNVRPVVSAMLRLSGDPRQSSPLIDFEIEGAEQ